MKRQQHCDYCGADMGVFSHSRRLDGPLTCGEPECNRYAAEQTRMEDEELADRARSDGYERYR